MFKGVPRSWRGVAVGRRVRVCAAQAWICLLLAASCSSLQAQVPVEGALRGTAFDQASAVVAHAQVTVTDPSRALLFHTLCDARGGFSFAHLPAGSYRVVLQAQGFAPQIVDRIIVQGGGAAELSIRLRIAAGQETITVQDDAASVDEPAGAAVSSVVSTGEIDQLPVDGRRWQSFALLAPAIDMAGGDGGSPLLSARGLAVTQNSSTLDGLADDNGFHGVARGAQSPDDSARSDDADVTPGAERGGAQRGSGSWRRSGAAYSFPQAAVREFRVSTQNGSALYGHGAGATIRPRSRAAAQIRCTAPPSTSREPMRYRRPIPSPWRPPIAMAPSPAAP
ncbi:MAG: carboxypeptidase-like regulatory domain-containing protein [Edaphobacter sp.]|uniref:carboxypeptidase-like regulatory domain-containing protein n=1 Tax=Edaphobacter sp. TaxID=1934404 RepID=UPI0023A6F7D3|nr:carboxypeptidase-like regulatory domain-containing protein [Edaphobacter sp.]MDE1176744.1 carboxypeptidase-like regulatory domain-containing protein [Edaphobacter sp.]